MQNTANEVGKQLARKKAEMASTRNKNGEKNSETSADMVN